MAEIPHQWRDYARLQQQVGRTRRADASSLGVEAGLDYLLSTKLGASERGGQMARVIYAASRRETYRRGVLRRIKGEADTPEHPEAAFHARLALDALRRRLTATEWDLLCDVGAGLSYEDIAQARGRTPGGCRVQVLRLRRTLSPQKVA